MCLLSVLCNSPAANNKDLAEFNDLVNASTLAVKAITSLVMQTLTEPVPGNMNVAKLIHVSRDLPILNQSTRLLFNIFILFNN